MVPVFGTLDVFGTSGFAGGPVQRLLPRLPLLPPHAVRLVGPVPSLAKAVAAVVFAEQQQQTLPAVGRSGTVVRAKRIAVEIFIETKL